MTQELLCYQLGDDEWEGFVPYAPGRWHDVGVLSLAVVRVAGTERTMPIRRTGDGVFVNPDGDDVPEADVISISKRCCRSADAEERTLHLYWRPRPRPPGYRPEPEDEFNSQPYDGRKLTATEREILRAVADGGRLFEMYGAWVSYRLQPSIGDERIVQKRHMFSLSRAGLIERKNDDVSYGSFRIWNWRLTDAGRAVAGGTWRKA